MSLLYDVYQHPTKGQWGVSVQGQTVKAVELHERGIKESSLQAYKLAVEVGKRIRMGFKKLARAKYLKVEIDGGGMSVGTFVDRNPELFNSDGNVLFTTKSQGDDLQLLTQQWESLLEKTDARPEMIDAWIKRVLAAENYIVASNTHPAFALVLGDWAIANNRLLVSDLEGLPTERPFQQPLAWQEWLSKSFDTSTEIRSALEQLGWSLRDALMKSDAAIANTDSDGEGWSADTSEFAF